MCYFLFQHSLSQATGSAVKQTLFTPHSLQQHATLLLFLDFNSGMIIERNNLSLDSP